MASFDDAAFRAQCPEFSVAAKYPLATLELYWDMAAMFIDTEDFPCRTLNGKQLGFAVNYLAAHLLTLTPPATNGQTMATGQEQGGFQTSATIDKVTVSKLAPPAKDAWDWWLYQTPYGQALLALLKLLAVGGFSIGGLPEREGFRKVGGVFW